MKLFKKYLELIVNKLFKKITPIGSLHFYLIISFLFLFLEYNKEFLILISGFFLLHLIAFPLRLIFFRERPIPKNYSNILEKINASSMPSLHSGRIVFLLLFLINFFNGKILFNLYLILITILVLYSRIYRKKHYVTDVIFGTLLGILVWYFLFLIF